ncbi:1,2-dihydroxy-3-keto-5-methylthiopentene dioxygenase [Dendronalium sp. ChiSLP03b]|uniref:1,2-dihydroxy-3-keto-5-methylthiopentene dioxygenase n=1 Tax=Dendronalium sp. ChiSLP03b TaxID=3075381 RepID=UPI002AD2EAE7|nr:cupin domain-containing protein [Dendronalium sp. ChiSLP03b]MDZ8202904.1 cupin domain-containing protein [Dendronalium sp. ChiSLP03b]
MAILLLDDGTVESDLGEISRELSPLGIYLKHYDPGTSLLFPNLIEQDVLTDSEKRFIVELHNGVFEFLQQENGYVWCDLLNLHPGSFNLETLIAGYNRYHTHTAAEPLYILAGEMIFGFIRPDGSQVQLLVQPQDYIYIPAGVEHWCSPTASLHCKAVRYFSTADGWVPNYTGTHLKDSLNKPR